MTYFILQFPVFMEKICIPISNFLCMCCWLIGVVFYAAVFCVVCYQNDLLLSDFEGGISIAIIFLYAMVIFIYVFFYNKIFAVTFDENFATATGMKAERYNLLIAVVTAVIIVLAMNLVGSLLISALVIFPALSAMQVIKNFKGVVICSAVISVLCALFGILASILFSTPVGSTIVAADIVVFVVMAVIGKCVAGR